MIKKNLITLLFSVCTNFCLAQQLTPFKAGDRIVFAGNSITEAGYYESYIWLYYMTHFPGKPITIINAGIGGQRAGDIYKRLDYDVFNHNPTVVAVSFGMNDSGFFEWTQQNKAELARQNIARAGNEFKDIEARLKAAPQVKKILLTATPYDETVKSTKNYWPGKNAVIDTIASMQQASAVKNGWGFMDFFHPMLDITYREQQKDPQFTIIGPDRVHPGNQGHFVMAYLFLKAQGLAGSKVADVAINATTPKAVVKNAVITGLKRSKNKLTFNYLAKSLPFPLDTVARIFENPHVQTEALSVIPWMEEFNTELLTVKGLAPGKYQLVIDNTHIADFSSAQLSAGINLAKLHNTPQYQQAMQIMQLNQQRLDIENRLREYYWIQYNFLQKKGWLFNDSQAIKDSVEVQAKKDWGVAAKKGSYMKATDKVTRTKWENDMKQCVAKIYSINKPKQHTFKLTLLK